MINKPKGSRQKVDIKGATVTMTDDTQNYLTAMIKFLNSTQKAQILTPYGFCCNPPDNSLAISLNIQGIASNKVCFVDDPKNRKKNLSKGEVAIVNYSTNACVYIKEDETIDIETPSGSKITMQSDGTIELNGDSDFITAFTDMKAAFDQMRTELNTALTLLTGHTHGGVASGSGTSGPGPTLVNSTADMSSAKVDSVKVP